MSALDDLLSDFASNAGTMPAVNPPEAAKVLATQTAPEVAGEPEPAPVETTIMPPTDKPAAVVAAEAAKTRKPRAPRQPKATPAVGAEPEATEHTTAYGSFLSLLEQVQDSLPEGVTLTITGRA